MVQIASGKHALGKRTFTENIYYEERRKTTHCRIFFNCRAMKDYPPSPFSLIAVGFFFDESLIQSFPQFFFVACLHCPEIQICVQNQKSPKLPLNGVAVLRFFTLGSLIT